MRVCRRCFDSTRPWYAIFVKIACIGGGPAGLYLGILVKPERPVGMFQEYWKNAEATAKKWREHAPVLHEVGLPPAYVLQDGCERLPRGEYAAVFVGGAKRRIAKRRGGRVVGRYAEDFETKSGRLALVGVDMFDISYFRHTGRWWTIQHDCTLKTALKYFREPSPLWPW